MRSIRLKKVKYLHALHIAIIITLSLILCSGIHAQEKELKHASFIPQWVPQAQFAGYYMAKQKGIYKKYGISLTIIPGGPERQSADYLKKGMADFGTLWVSMGLPLKDEGVNIVNIAQMMQRSALMLIAKKSSGIKSPSDMNGKKVGLWGSVWDIQPKAFFKKYNLDVNMIRQSYSVNLFLRDGVHVASAMWYNELHTIINSGIDLEELSTFFFYDHGLNFPEDGIYTSKELLERDPELCKAFVRASIEGWKYSFAHPDQALDLVMKNLEEAHIPATRVHQKWMLDRMKDLMEPADSNIRMGTLLEKDYNRVAQGLLEAGLIKKIPSFSDFYRNCRD